MNTKQIHYDIKPILETGSNYYIIFGEKSNGKSYQAKHLCLENYLKTGKRFILLRRWKDDISQLWCEKYFDDVDVKRLTDGKYTTITCYRKELFFSNLNDLGKPIRGEKIGYVIALSREQHMSGGSFLDVNIILFEEFMERGVYISKEPSKLMTLYSTIDRKKGDTTLIMVGNTITRVNPYLSEWGLQPIIRNMKQGDIRTTIVHNESNDVKLAIEYCRSSGGKTMAIGNASSMIDKGSWQSNPQPKLPKSKKMYKVLWRIGFEYQSFRFLGELLQDKENPKYVCWFIFPTIKEFKDKNLLIFTDKVSIDKHYQRNIYDLTFKNDNITMILQTFREGNIFYSDDLTGTDFKQVIDFSIRR